MTTYRLPILALLAIPCLGWSAVPASQLLDQAQKHQNTLIQSHTFEPFQPTELDLDALKKPSEPPTSSDGESCQQIAQIAIDNSEVPSFNDYLFQAAADAGYTGTKNKASSVYNLAAPLPCLSVGDMEKLVTSAQNNLIDDGWVTARVLIPEQNIKTGKLTIALLPGLFNQVTVPQDNAEQNNIHRLRTANALPVTSGEALNLRDIEQGLENFRRLPTVSAQIDIAPGEQMGSSDLVVHWAQKNIPLRISMGLDNGGSKDTGKYLGSIHASYDNPLRLNDIFSLSYTRNLLPGSKETDISGHSDTGETNNYSLSYSLPYKYWSLALGHSQYYYDQIVAGQTKNYHYSGKSKQWQADLSYVAYRNQRSKVTLTAGLWAKRNFNFVNDTEVGVQRRQTGGWQIGARQLTYFPQGTLSSAINYKQGERWFGAIPAPEEVFDEGTAKMGIVTVDVNWNMPFQIANQQFDWDTQWHGQYNTTKLTPVDRLSIGGRYTVRGFEGGLSLSAERGGYTQNNIAWHYLPNHRIYLGLDAGYVSGSTARQLPGKYLIGTALGIKGSHNWHGKWDYDAYIGKALVQPGGFEPDKLTVGFSFNYQLPL
ncbi:ShlB/FhaC/HecB family hemolysin secretion/activation protein [Cardiobacteriaceae bacterium TAE3-ERU3]|nr:ShlB/FhaC/HecB family hemolysin secretion/activation protein [Cardiobacteriaceae bacterium TAE3-ERU3]